MRTKILITNIPDLNVRLIDINHYNKAVKILFIDCSSYANLEQQKKNILRIIHCEAGDVLIIVLFFSTSEPQCSHKQGS